MLDVKKITDKKETITPFLRWAGGKRWLVSSYPELFPKTFNTYFEPFLGGGAVYFHLQPNKAVLADMNEELIDTYAEIRDDWKPIHNILELYDKQHSKNFYYEVRSKSFRCPEKKAAKFIYLNRTCFNGLYRVNSNGLFNVPIGTKTNVILNTDDFSKTSSLLKNTDLYSSDFEEIINMAQKNDFIFIDPPYTVKHNLNGFVQYNNKLFSWDDQIRLRDCIQYASLRGVKFLLTNADHESVRQLYEGVGEMFDLDRLSVISGSVKARGRYSELIVKNY